MRGYEKEEGYRYIYYVDYIDYNNYFIFFECEG